MEIIGDHCHKGHEDPPEPDAESDDEEIVFDKPIVGGSSALEGVAEKMRFNKIYAALATLTELSPCPAMHFDTTLRP